MKPSEVIAFINCIEERFPVDQWQVDGLLIWPLLRIELCFRLDDFIVSSEAKPSRSLWTKVYGVAGGWGKYLGAFLADHGHNESKDASAAGAVFLSHTTCRTFPVAGEWYDAFCAPVAELLETLGLSRYVFEYAPRDEYRIPRRDRSRFIQPQLSWLAVRNQLMWPDARRFEGEESFREFAEFFRRSCPGVAPPDPVRVRKRASLIRATADYFKARLKRLSPRIGFVVTYYTNVGMAFCLACRELGIPSVDIQHGVQGELHPAYGRWHRVPAAGYDLLPSRFWCWSGDDARVISEWSGSVCRWHEPFVGGNPLLGLFQQDDNELVRQFDRRILSITPQEPPSLKVLVTLQTGRGVPELLREVMAAAPPSWFWWVRLHPAMMAEREAIRDRLGEFPAHRMNLDDATELPLYALLRHVDVHLTESSSTVIEADRFGVPSVICHETGEELFAGLVAAGSARVAYSRSDVLDAVEGLAERRREWMYAPTELPPARPVDELLRLIRREESRRDGDV